MSGAGRDQDAMVVVLIVLLALMTSAMVVITGIVDGMRQ